MTRTPTTMTWTGRALAALATAGATLGLTALSHVGMAGHRGTDAIVRLAWSARPQRIETCRRTGDAEQQALPAHMRQREICEGTSARYRVEVRRDGTPVLDVFARGGGLRHDRQLYLLRDLAMPSGALELEVRVFRVDSSGRAVPGESERPDDDDGHSDSDARDDQDGGRRRRMQDEMPGMLLLRERVVLAPREVLLVTYDRDRRALRILRGAE